MSRYLAEKGTHKEPFDGGAFLMPWQGDDAPWQRHRRLALLPEESDAGVADGRAPLPALSRVPTMASLSLSLNMNYRWMLLLLLLFFFQNKFLLIYIFQEKK